MKKFVFVSVLLGISAALLICGCAQKAASGKDAIETSKTLETVQQQVDYLMSQANAFYNSKEFQQAIDVAQYILANLDKDSTQAKDLIERAKAELTKLGQEKLNEMKSKVGLQ